MSRPETITSEYVRGFRAGESSALERAAQEYGAEDLANVKVYCRHVAQRLRELKSPAAAPAAEPDPTCPDDFDLWSKVAPPSSPVAPSLLPRVLAALEGDWMDGYVRSCLAAELRRYIAETCEGET